VATILVVDDNPPILRMLTLALEENGFTVVAANNGAEALQILRSRRDGIDLVVSDVMMPEINGPALATSLSAEYPTLPVLLISGGSENLDLECLKSSRFLAKPFDLTTFVATVDRLLSERVSHAAA